MTQYQKGMLVMNYLKKLDTDILNIGDAIEDEHLEKSYQLIKENPKITKAEFLKQMGFKEKKH